MNVKWWNFKVAVRTFFSRYRWVVITKADEGAEGNQYDEMLPGDRNPADSGSWVKMPVFHAGEMFLVSMPSQREVGYPGRKPSKWDVDYETFHLLRYRKAIRRQEEAFEASLKRPVGNQGGA